MIRNIYRIAVGFVLIFIAGAMHDTAQDYEIDPENLARLTTARSINFAARLMDMGASPLILIGAAPFFLKPRGGPIKPKPLQSRKLIALNAPDSRETP